MARCSLWPKHWSLTQWLSSVAFTTFDPLSVVMQASCSSRKFQLVKASRSPQQCFPQCVLRGSRLSVDIAFSVQSLDPGSVQWGWCRALSFDWTKDLWYRRSVQFDPVPIPLSSCMCRTFLEWRLGKNNCVMECCIFGPVSLSDSQNHLWSLCL